MIKFSQRSDEKTSILNLIENEAINVEVSLTFQKKLNNNVLNYLKAFMNDNPFTNDCDNINSMSEYLNNTSKILKKSSSNIAKIEELQKKLEVLYENIQKVEKPSFNFAKTQIDDYNKKAEEVDEKTNSATVEIQTFLAKCEQDDILKELLSRREENSQETVESEALFNSSIEDSIAATIDTISVNENSTLENSNQETEITTVENVESLESEILDVPVATEAPVVPEVIVPIEATEIITPTEATTPTEITTPTEAQEIIEEQKSSSIEIPEVQNIETSKVETTNEEISKEPIELTTEEINNELSSINKDLAENTLLISEKNKTVTLPFSFKELQNKLNDKNNNYKSINEVIEKEYTKPLKYYKNYAFARFKETYKLVKERSNGSFKHAIDLAFEAFFNSDLHPAVISACKSIDELDIYLSCLEYDELEDFRFFKIIFDIVPSLAKRKNLLA